MTPIPLKDISNTLIVNGLRNWNDEYKIIPIENMQVLSPVDPRVLYKMLKGYCQYFYVNFNKQSLIV